MSEKVLEVRGLKVLFGPKAALDGLDLCVERGEIVGFVGPNGAGKTTCLRSLIGLVSRSAGSIDVLGMDPQRDSLAIRRRCCYLPGETSAYLGMTGGDFLAFALAFYPDRQPIADEIARAYELPLGRKVRTYSAGMKQKLALLATLTPEADLYLLDEPDRALDATARLQLREILRSMRAAGKSMLLSSHHLSEVDALATRTVFLLDGRNVPSGRVEAARDTLRREVRLRLDGELELPGGYEHAETLTDGSLRVRTSVEPLRWLATLPPERVVTAEVGVTRLEDLYRILMEDGDGEVQP